MGVLKSNSFYLLPQNKVNIATYINLGLRSRFCPGYVMNNEIILTLTIMELE